MSTYYTVRDYVVSYRKYGDTKDPVKQKVVKAGSKLEAKYALHRDKSLLDTTVVNVEEQ